MLQRPTVLIAATIAIFASTESRAHAQALYVEGADLLLIASPLAGQSLEDAPAPESVVWRTEDPWAADRHEVAGSASAPHVSAPDPLAPQLPDRLPDGAFAAPESGESRSSFGRAAAGSLGGWLVGGVVGAAIGHKVNPQTPEYAPLSDGAAAGMLVGLTLGPPLGAHLANRREGDVAISLAATVGVAGALFLVGRNIQRQEGRPAVAYLSIPVAQLVVPAVVEFRTGR